MAQQFVRIFVKLLPRPDTTVTTGQNILKQVSIPSLSGHGRPGRAEHRQKGLHFPRPTCQGRVRWCPMSSIEDHRVRHEVAPCGLDAGKRCVQLCPPRVMIRTLPGSTRTARRYPSHFSSYDHSSPRGLATSFQSTAQPAPAWGRKGAPAALDRDGVYATSQERFVIYT